MKSPQKVPQGSLTRRCGCIALALLAGGISVAVAAITGWNNGASFAERALWAAFGVVPVLGAHVLPALCRGADRWTLRATAWVMWAVCMTYAVYGHASYFLLIQQDAGARRAERVPIVNEPTASRRLLSAILEEEANIRGQLTRASSSTCRDCPWVRGRIAELNARIAALQAEAEEVRREQAQRDRESLLRDQRRKDPVTSSVAAWLGTDPIRVALAPALVFALILDGLSTLCWVLLAQLYAPAEALAGRSMTSLAIPVTPVRSVAWVTPIVRVTPVPPVTPVSSVPPVTPVTPDRPCDNPPTGGQGTCDSLGHSRHRSPGLDHLVQIALTALKSGALERATVVLIREHLRCSQATARSVRQALENRKPAP